MDGFAVFWEAWYHLVALIIPVISLVLLLLGPSFATFLYTASGVSLQAIICIVKLCKRSTKGVPSVSGMA